MKKVFQFVSLFCFIACLRAEADVPFFGNSPNGDGQVFSLQWYNYQSWGGAAGFTPSENIAVSSVTLWLQGYAGQDGLTFDAGIYSSGGFEVDSLVCPAPNDGSTAPFTFTGSVDLNAGQQYWLLLYAYANPPVTDEAVGAYWVTGGTPAGDATYDGDQAPGVIYGAVYTSISSSDAPAFTINTVPEPGIISFICVPLLLRLMIRPKSVRQQPR